MHTDHTDCARQMADGMPHTRLAPRAARSRRPASPRLTAFAMTLLLVVGMPPAAALSLEIPPTSAAYIDQFLDRDGNGVEDCLDQWLAGRNSWQELRDLASPPTNRPVLSPDPEGRAAPAQKVWDLGRLRVICLGASSSAALEAETQAAQTGVCDLLHDLDFIGGVRVLALDEPGLAAYLAHKPDGRVILDRDGIPALDSSTTMVGSRQLQSGIWNLGQDWSSSVAILDSGCDTAHNDLGDHNGDNRDGPPPAVGDASDWYPGDAGWPVFSGYRVVGWQDVSDDFPEAVGPWDYHYHGTALASVVAGSGRLDPDLAGVSPGARLTVVKFYDFDQTWHTWAGDFLAACAWTLGQRDILRIRVVLAAVNWSEDLGISDAINELVDAGMLPVVAMGNFGQDTAGPGYPALVPDALTVGAVNDAGALSAFSGRATPGQGKPDLLAPGGGLLSSAGRITCADNEPNDTYSPRQGTSLAAAHVAGAAFLLGEVLQDNGIRLVPDATKVRNLRALLKGTAARVETAESADGTGILDLGPHDLPDSQRGWGRLRADAAVAALMQPLYPGAEQTDTLSLDETRIVISRRLLLQPGVRYLLEAVPTAGLDVDLALVDPRHLDFSPDGEQVPRANAGGSGVSEFLYHEATEARWAFLTVRRVAGSGNVVLRLMEADTFPEQGRQADLPGRVTGPPNFGSLPLASGTTVVVPSRVNLDPQARSVNVFDGWGLPVPGWPVYVFPASSGNGGMTQPILWDMDGNPGDEIILSSDYGSLYFFNGLGAYNEVALEFNVALTPVVGWGTETGERRAVIVDDHGELRAYAWGPELRLMRDMGHSGPQPPAVGRLDSGQEERLVVAFGDGWVFALDSDGLDLPGWPVDLGESLTLPPVLVDLDGDQNLDIVLPTHDGPTGALRVRLLDGDGNLLSGDGTVLPPAEGARWLEVTDPVVAGRAADGDLRVEMAGLVDNGFSGVQAGQHLARAGWLATGAAFSERMPHLDIEASTNEGFLENQRSLLCTPLAWDFRDGPGSEIAVLGALRWQEIIFGQTAVDGSTTGWFLDDPGPRVLPFRPPAAPGGSEEATPISLAAGLVPLGDDAYKLVQVRDVRLNLLPMRPRREVGHFWPLARCDQRNSGAYPVGEDLSPVVVAAPSRLAVYPNPGPGRFHFRWAGAADETAGRLTVYDLRGRRVTEVRSDAEGRWVWDGRDRQGRQAAAGAYLAVARRGGRQATVRILLTR